MTDVATVRARIEEACVAEMELSAEVARQVSFHMTDWLEDLKRYAAFVDSPSALSSQQVGELLAGFLVHVPNHVAAASRLYMDMPVSDVFEVGAVNQGRR